VTAAVAVLDCLAFSHRNRLQSLAEVTICWSAASQGSVLMTGWCVHGAQHACLVLLAAWTAGQTRRLDTYIPAAVGSGAPPACNILMTWVTSVAHSVCHRGYSKYECKVT
jgi:hypothetical protein